MVHPSLVWWVIGSLFPGIKQSGPETDHSPSSDVGVKNAWRYTFTSWCYVHLSTVATLLLRPCLYCMLLNCLCQYVHTNHLKKNTSKKTENMFMSSIIFMSPKWPLFSEGC